MSPQELCFYLCVTTVSVISSEFKQPNIRNYVSVTLSVAVVDVLDIVHVPLSYSYTGLI